MNAASVAEWSAGMRPAKVEIFMPKFKQESSYDLSTTLAALGMGSAFDAGTAGLLRHHRKPRHGDKRRPCTRPFVEVSEEGTEAAAATRRHSHARLARAAGACNLLRRQALRLHDPRQRKRSAALHRQIRPPLTDITDNTKSSGSQPRAGFFMRKTQRERRTRRVSMPF